MTAAYEDPKKTQMRQLVKVAIDQAGFDLVEEPKRIALPTDTQILGSLLGDIQSLDADGVRTFYYLRPVEDRAVPKWIANLARASHAASAGLVYIVAHSYVPELIKSCKECGCGLLRLTEDGLFEIVVDYSETAPRTLADVLESRLTTMRRAMERRVDSVRIDIDSRLSSASPIIGGMEGEKADRYRNGFDAEYRSLQDWGDDMSRRLDALGAESSLSEIGEVDSLIQAGPPTVSS